LISEKNLIVSITSITSWEISCSGYDTTTFKLFTNGLRHCSDEHRAHHYTLTNVKWASAGRMPAYAREENRKRIVAVE
jgi:hypothetical protein